jgi:carbonic anhydrase/acetyltransferase-like protein (isoleucine patch superfamily)
MGAIIMDEAEVEENCLIAAGAVVLENTICHAGGIYAGVPAKRVKELTPDLFKGQIERIANNYLFYAGWYQ